jgi:acetyltransferase-like isoleucine patch superfamily enzyme
MVNDTLALDEAVRCGLVSLGSNTEVSAQVRFLPNEDQGQGSGQILIGDNVRIRAGAILCSGVEIGDDTVIGHQCVVRARTKVGKGCVISHLVCLERDTRIGDHVRISALTHITGGCHIGDRVQIGARVVTVNDNEMRWQAGEVLCAPRILEGARIGSGCTLLGHVTVGERAFIGAGSVVTRDIPSDRLAYGNPAYVQGETPSDQWRAGASSLPGITDEESQS